MRRWSSISPLTASVPPLLAPPVRSSRGTRGATVAGSVRGGRFRGSGSRGGCRGPVSRSVGRRRGWSGDRSSGAVGRSSRRLRLRRAFVGGECGVEPVALPVGEAFLTGAEQVTDPVERVGLAAAVAVDLLLEPAAALVDGHIHQPHITTAVAIRDHTTQRAPLWSRRRLHRDAQPAAGLVGRHGDHVEPVQTHEQVTTRAVRRVVQAARVRARRRLRHRRGLPGGCLVATDPEGLDPLTPGSAHLGAPPTPTGARKSLTR